MPLNPKPNTPKPNYNPPPQKPIPSQYTITIRFDLPDTKKLFIHWWNTKGAKLTAKALEYHDTQTRQMGLVFDTPKYDEENNEIFIAPD